MKRALVSVSDKTNLIPFVSGLIDNGYEIISTGGTKKAIEEAGLPVISISDVTGFPEIMDGRVKTLHPKVHGALLCVRDNPEHVQALKDLDIDYIDLVCVNLYPFKETVQKEGVSHEEIIENIDIGGPSMLRSASKNYRYIPVLCDPADYEQVLSEIKENGETSLETREKLAAKVFRHTARYDAMIADYLTKKTGETFPESMTITFDKVQDLRYGENPHQKAAFYKGMNPKYSLANAKQLHGKELSYNNIQDGNAAIEILKDFEGQPAAVGLKHMNPCGVGIGATINEAWDKAYEADPVSIFGGIVALNEPVDAELAEKLSKIFLEIVIAPKFDEDALDILTRKKNIRLMELDTTLNTNNALKYTNVNDGLLVQDMDTHKLRAEDLRCVTNVQPTPEQIEQMLFGWNVVKHVKSNAIVLVKDNMTVGVGAGQMNRVGAAKIAIEQAGEKAKGSILASDAFFPMPDTVQSAIEAGVSCIIQPGGSIKDQLSIDECNKYGIPMVFTGVRHFKH
jgi:phosphoribosylaminoimidazolecarboxamide formyltransferase/IMP cyclohydrolase